MLILLPLSKEQLWSSTAMPTRLVECTACYFLTGLRFNLYIYIYIFFFFSGYRNDCGSKSVCVVLCLVAQLCSTLCDPMEYSPPGSSVHEDYPGKNTGGGCHILPQRIFPTQRLNLSVPHRRLILYCLSHQRSPKVYVSLSIYLW